MNTTTARKSECDLQAEKFLTETGVKFSVKYSSYGKYFADDKEQRNIYLFTFKRGEPGVNYREYSARFGASLAEGSEPSAYDVLACLTKYDPGTLENFCSEFGYDTDSKKAEKVYKAVCKEYEGVCSIWNRLEREALAEIQ